MQKKNERAWEIKLCASNCIYANLLSGTCSIYEMYMSDVLHVTLTPRLSHFSHSTTNKLGSLGTRLHIHIIYNVHQFVFFIYYILIHPSFIFAVLKYRPCLESPRPCSHLCLNNNNGYQCGCPPSSDLLNGSICSGECLLLYSMYRTGQVIEEYWLYSFSLYQEITSGVHLVGYTTVTSCI